MCLAADIDGAVDAAIEAGGRRLPPGEPGALLRQIARRLSKLNRGQPRRSLVGGIALGE